MPKLLALLVILILWGAADAVAAPTTSCACARKSSTSSQTEPNVCVTIEGAGSCSVEVIGFGVSPNADGARRQLRDASGLAGRIAAAGVRGDAFEILAAAAGDAPEAWPDAAFADRLTSLIALAQGGLSNDQLAGFRRALMTNGAAYLPAFRDRAARRPMRAQQGGTYATISYGCIELEQGGLLVQARLPSALAHKRCSDF